MSLKKVLFNKYGILIKESESDYFNYLMKNSKKNYDYVNVLKEFADNCTTRYFKKNKIKSIAKELINEEIGRNYRTPYGKGDSGNYTVDQAILDKHDIHVEEAVDTMSGEDAIYIEDENKNNEYIKMEKDYMPIFKNNIVTKNINK
tara:strand:+ start:1699 stop:2136 length:438 start_codon:yes stop_codon:yes gene_type:complete